MNTTCRVTPWNTFGNTAFGVDIDGDATTIGAGAGGLLLHFPYQTRAYGEFADPQGLNAHLISLEGWLGYGSDGNSLPIRLPSQIVFPNNYGLSVPITSEQLADLDAVRGTDPLYLSILLAGTARVPVSRAREEAATNEYGVLTSAEFPGEVQSVRMQGGTPVTLTISRERWLTILNNSGPRRYRLIELPLPVGNAIVGLLPILEQAIVLLRRGEWRDAIAKARQVVEGVLVETADRWNVPRPTDGHVKWCEGLGRRLENAWPDDSTSGLLFGRLLASAWSWTSVEHHYSPSIVSKRSEAEFAIGLASDLLLLAGELLDAHPQASNADKGS